MNRRLLSIVLSVITVLLLATACTDSDTNDSKMGVNTFGNTSGNQANGGLVAVQGEWVYFILRDYPGAYGNLICKRNIDETEETYWSTNAGYNLNVIGNWIYYKDYSASYLIRKMQTNDDGNYEEISNVGSDFQAVGDWIYCNSENGNGFYRMWSDGKRQKRLMKDSCRLFYVDGNRIFYTTSLFSRDPQGLYSIGINGKEKTLIVSGELGDIACLNVEEDWIYYASESMSIKVGNENYGIWKIRKDATERTRITLDFGTINVADGWVYYTNSNDNSSLYKIRTDGTEKTKLHSDTTDQINIAGEWIYYPIMKSDGLRGDLYRIRTDGTDRQRVTLNNFIPETPTTYSVYIQEQTTIPDLTARIPY